MKTLKQIEEFDIEGDIIDDGINPPYISLIGDDGLYSVDGLIGMIKEKYQEKINQLLDEIIGEEKRTFSSDPIVFLKCEGYNQKRDEIIKFKEKFNE